MYAVTFTCTVFYILRSTFDAITSGNGRSLDLEQVFLFECLETLDIGKSHKEEPPLKSSAIQYSTVFPVYSMLLYQYEPIQSIVIYYCESNYNTQACQFG